MRRATKISISLLSVLVALAWYSGAWAAGGTSYDLRARLDFDRGELNVSQKVVYLNKTSTNLSSIVFNVSPAHFKAFNLLSAKAGGQDVQWRLDGVSLELTLPGTVRPGEYVEIELAFDLRVPPMGGRFGTYDHVMALGNWYPVVAVYRGGWSKHGYTPFGDPFFTEVADYEVVIESLSNVEIAHTGNLVKREGNTWHFRAEKVRDFALALSDRYEAKSVEVDGVKVTAFNQPGRSAGAALFLDSTAQALRWLNKRLGKYPYESLHIAEVNPGKENLVGQEYPNLVFISSAYAAKPEGPKSYASYLIAHEVAHQWFYNLVGNDQLREPWIDESLATYLAYRILEWNPLSLSSPSVTPSGKSPVDSTVDDFKDETQYSATTYGKGTVFLQELAGQMKEKSIDDALKEFVDLYKYKVATTRDFLNHMQSSTSSNLNPLIRRYFSGADYGSDSPLRMEIAWPKEDAWMGVVQIGFTADAPIRHLEVSADGIEILKTDGPASPLTVDTSGLTDGEYVVGIAAVDESGRVAQAARRITVSGGLLTRPAEIKVQPTPTPAQPAAPASGPTMPFNIKLPDYGSALSADITVDVGRVAIGVSALGGLFILLMIFMTIQSRRSFKSNYQFSGPKPTKRAGVYGTPPKAASIPEVKPISRPSYSIVTDSISRISGPLDVAPGSTTASPKGMETTVKPAAPVAPSASPVESEASRAKGRSRACSAEGFGRKDLKKAESESKRPRCG